MLKVDNMQGTGIIVVNRKKFVYKRGIFFCNMGLLRTWCVPISTMYIYL